MIRGAVGSRLEARITLTFLDAAGSPVTLGVVIDTAFSGFLALPSAVIAHLAVPSLGRHDVVLADGSTITQEYYEARVEWQGTIRTVRAVDMGTEPLVGINFLWAQRITIDVIVGGDVTVEPLP
jgi:clan AA aspartic protease